MPGIGGDDAQRLGGGLEQDAVDDGLILEGYRCDLGRQCEDHVEIGDRQQVVRTCRQPVARGSALALRAVPVAAGIISDMNRTAGSATLDMAAERGRAAQFDCGYHAALHPTEMAAMGLNIGRAVVAEDVRHLQCGAHEAALSRAAPPPSSVDRAGSASLRSSSWQPACIGPWSTDYYARAAPG